MNLGRYQEAIESYEEALKLGLTDREIWEGLNKALERLDDFVRRRKPSKLHTQLYETVAWIEETLHMFVRQRLEKAYGAEDEQWWTQGVPLPIRQKCAQRREEDPRRRPPYNYIDLVDLKEVLDKNWRYFEADFDRVKGQVIKTKKDLLDSLVRLNEIRKTVMHPVRGPATEGDLKFALEVRDIVKHFCPFLR